MQRLTISVNKQLADSFDQLIDRKGYRNRSEAFRDLLRRALRDERLIYDGISTCVACVSYVYDQHQRLLGARLADLRQKFSGVTVSSNHVPIDPTTCMETLILRGTMESVLRLADAIVAETGVRHGHLNLVPMESSPAAQPESGQASAWPKT